MNSETVKVKNKKSPSPGGEGRGEVDNSPLSFQHFKRVLHQEHPETKDFNRAKLRKIYRGYKKQRKNLKP